MSSPYSSSNNNNNNNYYYYYYSSQFQGHNNFPPVAETFPGVSFLAIPEEHDSLSALRYTSSYGAGSPTSYGSQYSFQNMSSSPPGMFDETTSVRRSDLQGVSLGQQNSPSTESSIIESMNRANPYSPEEKRERIERYRNKRNLRNFNKKIKYECRKTLADSRPRIRGRFARNDEIENKTPQSQWDPTGVEEYDDDDENWIGFLDSFSANVMP